MTPIPQKLRDFKGTAKKIKRIWCRDAVDQDKHKSVDKCNQNKEAVFLH